MPVEDRIDLAELKRLSRAEKDARLAKRIPMVVLAIEGGTSPAITTSRGMSRRSRQHWDRRFHERGLQGLLDESGGAS